MDGECKLCFDLFLCMFLILTYQHYICAFSVNLKPDVLLHVFTLSIVLSCVSFFIRSVFILFSFSFFLMKISEWQWRSSHFHCCARCTSMFLYICIYNACFIVAEDCKVE